MLQEGQQASDFSLPQAGGGQVKLFEALLRGPVVLAFYKFNCPTCQFTFPFLQRVVQHLTPTQKFSFFGVAQDDETETLKFKKDFGITFDLLCDKNPYPVSVAYGLKTVPSIFLIGADRKILKSFEAFDKKAIAELTVALALIDGKAPFEAFRPGDQVPLLKPG